MEDKDFKSELDGVMERVSREERVVVGADFHGHAGEGHGQVCLLWKSKWWWILGEKWLLNIADFP